MKIKNLPTYVSVIFVSFLVLALVSVMVIGEYRDQQTTKTNIAKAKEYQNQMEIQVKESEKQESINFPYKDKKWLAIGDSITYNNKYQSKVVSLCKIAKVTTDASPGQQLGAMTDRLTSENTANIDLITVFGGTNDYGENKPLGTINDDKTKNTFYGNIKKVIDRIQTLTPKARIVFFTPLMRGKVASQPNQSFYYPAPNGIGIKLEQYVQAIKDVCGEKSIQVIDLFSNSGIDLNNLSEYTVDNLHPNDAGYDKISKVISDSLNNNNNIK